MKCFSSLLVPVCHHGVSLKLAILEIGQLSYKMGQACCRVGCKWPSAEVRFKNLTVETDIHEDASRNLPSILGSYRECVEVGL